MIAILPAAGHATRIQKLPKFLLPIPGGYLLKVLCDRLTLIGANIAIGTNPALFEPMRFYAPGEAIVYQVDSRAMPETVLAGRPYAISGELVICAMPDTYWTDETVLQRLAAAFLNQPDAVVAAVLWQVDPVQRHKLGMCVVQGDEILGVVDKPEQTDLEWAWGVIAWRTAFWSYIDPADPHMGVALRRAIAGGRTVHAVYADGPYFDCGTADDYFHLIRSLTEPEVVA